MTWNFRIIKHNSEKHSYFAIHEVFYGDKNEVISWTEKPIDIVGDSRSNVKRIFKQMALDIETPVLIESELLKSLK